MCFANDDVSDVWSETIVCSRKRHACDDCSSGILPGELYRRIGNLYCGQWSTLRICARCCWDHARVYQHEISVGCRPSESYCPVGHLDEHLAELAANEKWTRATKDEENEDAIMSGPSTWDPSPITYREAN